jgi:hypothetical protein
MERKKFSFLQAYYRKIKESAELWCWAHAGELLYKKKDIRTAKCKRMKRNVFWYK